MRRLILFLAVLACAAGPSSAQSPRAVPLNDNLANARPVIVPDTRSELDGDLATIEPGETAHLCTAGGATTGTGSIWFRLQLPGGKLTIDSAQSEFDTAITLYEHTTAAPASYGTLVAVGCADDGKGGSPQARLKRTVGAGQYYVQLSRLGGVPAGAENLRAAFTFKPDMRPKGDFFSDPIELTIGKVAKSNHIQYALHEAFEVASSCDPEAVVSSVWFRLDVPFNAALRASAEGTIYSTAPGTDTTVTTSVFSGLTPDTLDEEYCSADAAVTDVVFSATAGDTLWIRMTVASPTNLFRHGVYKLHVRLSNSVLYPNAGFESDLTGWTLKNADNGDGITTVGGEVIDGTKSFKFVGSANEATTLSRTVAIPPNVLLRNAVLTSEILIWALSPPQTLNWTVTLVPRTGAPIKYKHGLTVQTLNGATIQHLLPFEKLKAIKLKISNKNQSGSFTIDGVELKIRQTTVLRGTPAGVLPVPPLP